jgi:hypothetical protein
LLHKRDKHFGSQKWPNQENRTTWTGEEVGAKDHTKKGKPERKSGSCPLQFKQNGQLPKQAHEIN